MAFTSADVMKLREITGAGVLDCKGALTHTDGNFDEAIKYLREKGMASAAKKATRIASEGVVESYIHGGGKIGVIVEINCETDFVARSDQFKDLAHDVALQIAASKPEVVSREEVDPAKIKSEREILVAQAKNEEKPKPDAVIEKMVEGRIQKYLKDICLLEQEFVKDSSKTIQDVINEAIAKIGEKISVRRFVRYEMGEGLVKRENNFADEVAAQTGQK